jgi:hypothetical protein
MTNDKLTIFLESIRTDIINSMQASGKYATGSTAKQLTIVDNGENVQLQMPPYLQALETGRKPTGNDAVPADPPMIQRIQQWCQAKGITDKAAWAIKKSIDKKGYKGTQGIITEPLSDDNINLRLNPVMESIAEEISKELIGLLNLT